ncbi:MAG TPA: metal-dependent hydrolase [Cytophagaceae bacterium]
MDSITQIILGASVGEAVCGKRAGNKALLWGAIAGTIPDLDVLSGPFVDLVDELYYHRGITHSFLFAVIVSPILGYLLHRIYKKDKTTFKDWTLLFFFGFTTHALLDSFTTWGTKLFYPFSDYGVAFHTIFVVDPLYTVPFLICLITVMFYPKTDKRRRLWNYAGLTISTAYLLFTVINKFIVDEVFEKSMQAQNINYIRYSTKPTPFNSLLWNVTAETDKGYYIGYYSLLDSDTQVDFNFFPKNHELLNPYLHHKKLQTLLEITTGYFTVEKNNDTLLINDLRFGQLDGWGKGQEGFTFVYIIEPVNGNLQFSQKPNDIKKARGLIGDLFNRVIGKKI